MQRKILWISLNAPYDKVKHAGGQTLNFYLKQLMKKDENDICIISFTYDEMDLILDDLNEYKINGYIYIADSVNDYTTINKLKHYNIFNRYAGFLNCKTADIVLKRCEELKQNNYIPDVIVLEWTQIILMINDIKKIFPMSKFICSEHDVVFQVYERMCIVEENKLKKLYYSMKKNMIKYREINALNESDGILVQSGKDRSLLQRNKCNKSILEITPYFNIPNEKTWKYKAENNSIIFFGAMDRKENYEAGEWIIQNLAGEMRKFNFYLIGNKPPESLVNCQYKNVKTTGFVEQVGTYFQKGVCFIAPLRTGAGIKVKVLQAMAFGVPVLTNKIGIEGIEAKSGVDFLECTSKEEYIQGINRIKSDPDLARRISENGRKTIDRQFDFNKSVIRYDELIKTLAGK